MYNLLLVFLGYQAWRISWFGPVCTLDYTTIYVLLGVVEELHHVMVLQFQVGSVSIGLSLVAIRDFPEEGSETSIPACLTGSAPY